MFQGQDIASCHTVKAEALSPGVVALLPDRAELYRYYDGYVDRKPVLVATKTGIVVEETAQSWRPRDE
jgi:hypothetical protein